VELAIDTSTDIAGVAVSDSGVIIAENTWRCVKNHTVELVPVINNLIKQSGSDYSQIKGVVVARGPGAYNGLRVGISTAKGIALALKVPVVGISTLEIEAYPFAFTGLMVCPIHDAGRDEIAVAMFLSQKGALVRHWDERLERIESLCRLITERTVFCGELTPDTIKTIISRLGELALFPPDSVRLRRPACLVEIGWKRLSRGEADTPASLQPLYLRAPHITQSKKK